MSERDERVFVALADSTRRELLATLATSSPKTATQLAEEFPITRQGILKHLDVLAAAGLVQVRAKGREKRYWLAPEPLQSVSVWIDSLSVTGDAPFQRLKDLVESDEVF